MQIRATKKFLLFILIFLISTDLSILFDIPILRQVLGFAFFTFVPGFLILCILKLNKLGLTEKFVLSVGLSISFLMFAGLFINSVYPFFGYDTPLSTVPLTIFFTVIILILTIVAYLRSRTTPFAKLSDFKLSVREKAFLLLPAIFPLLGIVGMRIMNTTSNNIMLIALLFLIPAYAIFISIKHNQVPDRTYPLIVFLVSISLVLLLGLRSNHIIGVDAHIEYHLFQQTFHNGQWQILLNITVDTCLSVTILPTIYQSFLNMDSEYLFKILYPLLFSISPLVVYIVSKKYIGNLYAFLASLFFMSQITFLWTAFNPRTTIAILFFALSIMVLFHDSLGKFDKKLLFIIFTVSCILSHYATTYIVFFVLLFTWLAVQVTPRILLLASRQKPSLSTSPSTGSDPPSPASQATTLEMTPPRLRPNINISTVALFLALSFFWYSQVSEASFYSGVKFIYVTLTNLQSFFILGSRGGGVEAAFGVELLTKGIPEQIHFVVAWLTIAFIAIGLLTTFARYRHMVALSGERERGGLEYLSRKFDVEFLVISFACAIVLVVAVALPYVFRGYSMDRTYCLMMVALSPFFATGGMMAARFLRVRWAYLVILVALVPYFMYNTGTMHQMFGVPRAITLNSEGHQYGLLFIHDQEIYATGWLKDYAHEDATIHADSFSFYRSLDRIRMSYLGSLIEENKSIGEGYIYLRYSGAVDGKLMDRFQQWHDIAKYRDEFIARSLIYTNGGSEVWR